MKQDSYDSFKSLCRHQFQCTQPVWTLKKKAIKIKAKYSETATRDIL